MNEEQGTAIGLFGTAWKLKFQLFFFFKRSMNLAEAI